MSAELITYGSDRRLVLSAGEAIRAPEYLNIWSTLRIGLRGHFADVSGNLTGTPRLVVGACNGNTNGYGAVLSDHVVGFRTGVATWTYSTGPVRVNPFSSSHHPVKRVGSTVTSGSSFGAVTGLFSTDSAVRNALIIEIVKGSPNFTVQAAFPNNTTAAGTDVTDAKFSELMEMTSLSDASTVLSGYTATAANTIAVDEATDGDLDHLFIYWDRTTQKFTFDIKHRMVA